MVKASSILPSSQTRHISIKTYATLKSRPSSRILVQVSFWRNWERGFRKNVEVCVSFVRIQRNIFANFVHSPESSTLRRRISSYLWSRGLARWPKSFPQGQQFLKTRSQKARRCIQRSHPSSSARELLYRTNWTRKRGQFATLSWFGCGGSRRIWKFSYCHETGIDPSIQINWMTRWKHTLVCSLNSK